MEPLPRKQRIAVKRVLKKHIDKAVKLLGAAMFPPGQSGGEGHLQMEIQFAEGVDERGLYERCSNAEDAIRMALGKELHGVIKGVSLLGDAPPERCAIIDRSIKERYRGKGRIAMADAGFCFSKTETSMTVFVEFDENHPDPDIEEILPDLVDSAHGCIGGEMHRVFHIIELAVNISGTSWLERLKDSEESAEDAGRPN